MGAAASGFCTITVQKTGDLPFPVGLLIQDDKIIPKLIATMAKYTMLCGYNHSFKI